jgi:Neurotransmitter-gated ion-channel transmembrane region
MIMVSIALVMAVIVTNIFMRKDTNNVMPNYLRCIFIRRNRRRLADAKLPSNCDPSSSASAQRSTVDNAPLRRRFFVNSTSVDNHCGNKEHEMAKLTSVSGCLLETKATPKDVDPDSLSVLSRLDSFKNYISGGGGNVGDVKEDNGGGKIHYATSDAGGGVGPWTLASSAATAKTTTSFLPQRRSNRLSDTSRQRRSTGTVNDASAKVNDEGLTAEQIEARLEWQELARVVDRLFFWLFMLSSISLLAILGYTIVQR